MPKVKGILLLLAALILASAIFFGIRSGEAPEPVLYKNGPPASRIQSAGEEEWETGKTEETAETDVTDSEEILTEEWIFATQPLMVNINEADAAELEKLPGIGPGKAQAILTYRREKGPFSSIEELMLVPGIKEATFRKLKDYVTV